MKRIVVITYIFLSSMTYLHGQSGLACTSLEVQEYYLKNKPEYKMEQSQEEGELVLRYFGTTAPGYREMQTYVFDAQDSCYLFAITTSVKLLKNYRKGFDRDSEKTRIEKDKWHSMSNNSKWVIEVQDDVIHIVNMYE